MSNSLCVSWQQLMAHPSDAHALAAVKSRLTEFLDHIDECEACRQAGAAAADPNAVLELLAASLDALSPEELAELDAIEKAWSDDENSVRKAVTGALLPSLPSRLQQIAALGSDVEPLKVFLAANAVNTLVYSRASLHKREDLTLSAKGFSRNGALEVPAKVLIAEIARHASLRPASAARVYEWLLDAAPHAPKLFLEFVTRLESGRVVLRLDTPALKHDLFARWAPAVPKPQPAQGLAPALTIPGVAPALPRVGALGGTHLRAAASQQGPPEPATRAPAARRPVASRKK